MAVVGYDLGNQSCVIARAGRGGVDVLLNGASKRQNACAVSLQGKQRFMGDEASAIARSNFKNTATNFKRLIGRKFAEAEVQEELSRMPGVKFVEMPEDGTVGIQVMYNDEAKVLSMEQCMAMMLTKLGAIVAEAEQGKEAVDIVLSIPGWYTDAQRVAMLNACTIANMKCVRLLHDGTAAALEYGMFKNAKGLFDAEKPTHVAFVDLGHSSFSMTIASFVTGKLYIKAAAFDRLLGGRDYDDVIGKKIAEAFKEKHKDDPWENTKARMKLLVSAEKCKKTLSPPGVTEANVNCECLLNDIDFNMSMKLAEFREGAEPLLARMLPVMQKAVEQSGIAPADITTVEIVGGSTRLGFVKERIADILIGLGLPIDKSALNMGLSTTMNADEATARGTAWQAALLSPRFRMKEYQIFDAVTYPVQLSWDPVAENAASAAAADDDDKDDAAEENAAGGGATSAVLFKKNEAAPSAKKVTFRRGGSFKVTASYDQSAVAELPPGLDTTVRVFDIDAPPAPADAEAPPKIRVTVKYNTHGIVEVPSAQLMEEIKEEPKPPAVPEAPAAAAASEEKKMDVDAKEEGDGAAAAAAAAEPASGGEGKDGEGKEAKPDDKQEGKDGEDQAKAPAEEAPKKKRFKKVDLPVTANVVGMGEATLMAAQKDEEKMAKQDALIEETNAAKNDVEAYIYSQRDTLIGDLRDFSQDSEKEEQEAALTAAEDWLYYGDGYDVEKSVYVEKLRDLKKKGEKMVYRQLEARDRDACVKGLTAAIEDYKKWLVSAGSEEAYAHITDEEKATVRSACEESETWVYAQLEAQAKLAKNVDPCFSCQDVNSQRKGLVGKCKPVVNKPKPLPPKPEPAAEKPAEEGGSADNAGAADKEEATPPPPEGSEGATDKKEEGEEPEKAAEGKEESPIRDPMETEPAAPPSE